MVSGLARRWAASTLIPLALTACAPEIRDLGDAGPDGWARPPFPRPERVALRAFDQPSEARLKREQYHVPVDFARRLAEFWCDNETFREAAYPVEDAAGYDLLAHGEVVERWDHDSGRNFLIAFPGGMVFLPVFVGFHYVYYADARIDLYEPRTRRKIKEYRASVTYDVTSQELRGLNFWLYNFLIAPGVIFAVMQEEAHSSLRTLVYERAHQDLWRRITARMLADPPVYEDP
ncbi:MAG: hypothetical protein K8I02_09500 [Candidatus Methylomirabilis sp.]|nr:hypothetical protein [Deltaproteobacteria bacterium]